MFSRVIGWRWSRPPATRGSSVLTHDYGFFATVVDDLRPETVMSGGTLIGDAMRTALDRVFLDEDAARFQDIILSPTAKIRAAFRSRPRQRAETSG